MPDPHEPAVLRYAAEEHLALMGEKVVAFDEAPTIDTTPTGGAWVAAWVWVPDQLAAVTAEMIQENQQ